MHRMLQTDDPKVIDEYSNQIRKGWDRVIASHTEPITEPLHTCKHTTTLQTPRTDQYTRIHTPHLPQSQIVYFPIEEELFLRLHHNSSQHCFDHLSLLIIPMRQSVISTANIKLIDFIGQLKKNYMQCEEF